MRQPASPSAGGGDNWTPPEAFGAPPLLPGGMSMTHGQSMMKDLTPTKEKKNSEVPHKGRPRVGEEEDTEVKFSAKK